ncbi:MAG: 2-dehydro-3-deoxy-D-gluconate 5-dehydrogenase [Burkholderiales bacterium]|jgi:NAD(P)-dependent dehydrogenase (short-subunit alcohol dehydrogenase family)|nr:2-dehydro-3-deoxy-D-gluconate 5-dehydrogenase [Burkholderiales bacterium]
MNLKTRMQTDLTGKVALVTGASRGLGAYYAKILSDNGAHVIVTGRASSEQQLNEVVKEIVSNGNSASPLILDMADFNSFTSKIALVVEQFSHIDILVNNAGISVDKALFDITEHDWDLHMDTNLKGLFFLSQVVARQMKQQDGYSSIINIAALNGQKVRKNCLPFAVSKAGVIHLTKTMAYELINHKIKVNAIVLGLFPSEVVEAFLANDPSAKAYLNRIPAKRSGQFADLDGPLLLLASDASNYMYGSTINVDGGFSTDIFMDLDIKNAY